MPDRVVVDSCVIAAVFFREDASDAAARAIGGSDCTTIDLAYAEVSNVAWKRVRFFGHDRNQVQTALVAAREFIRDTCDVLPASGLMDEAFDLACRESVTIYDALFVAASDRERVPLVTLDARLYEQIQRTHPSLLVAQNPPQPQSDP